MASASRQFRITDNTDYEAGIIYPVGFGIIKTNRRLKLAGNRH